MAREGHCREGIQMDFQEGDGAAPESLEVDRVSPHQGQETAMDTNGHSIEIPAAIQCSDRLTASNRSTFSNIPQEMVGFNRNVSRLGRFDDYGLGSGEGNNEILKKLKEQFNEMVRYDVKEPVGYGLLIGCKGPKGKQLSDAVFKDVQIMKKALSKIGHWETRCLERRTNLTKMELYEEINDLQLQELEKYSMFLLYFSGHGDHKGVVLTDNCTVEYKDIVLRVAKIDQLKGKPKVFIFDTCRLQNTSGKSKLKSQTFPPADTIVCFSTAKYCPSQIDNHEGSFYTLAIAHSISTFGGKYSFQEIVTYSSYISQEIGKIYKRPDGPVVEQLPMLLSSLDKLLMLSANGAYKGIGVVPSPMEESMQFAEDKAEAVYKGLDYGSRHGEVERDIVHLRDVEVKSEWKSREQVIENLSTLGDGISVFVIYAPNPDDPYQTGSSDEAVLRNKVLILRLIYDLERHGFHILSDIHLGDTEPTNWLKWYVSRILQCNFVLMVCSPAFKEVFQGNPLADKIVNEKTKRLLEYSNAIYSELEKSSSKSKFLPVILDHYSKDKCVPALFGAGTVYRIGHEGDPRKFDYDRSRDFERLVCFLAGIDRNRLGQPKLGQVKILENPYEIRDMELRIKEENVKRLLERPAGLMTEDELGSPSNLASTSSPGVGSRGGRTPASQAGIPSNQPMIGLAQPVHHSQPPPHLQQTQQPHPYLHQSQQSHPYLHQAQQSHPHLQQAQQPLQTSEIGSPDSLPLRIPDTKIYLWLSGEILSWKFVARNLGLSETDIETIQTDHQGVEEYRYQMFKVWERRYYQDCTYQKLGRVLFESEKNRKLYPEYVRRVKDIEQL